MTIPLGVRFFSIDSRCRLGLVSLLLALALTFACRKNECAGVLVAGECQQLCRDSACAGDGRCVQNQCAPSCSRDADCSSGECRAVRTDSGERANHCVGGAPPNGSSDDGDSDDGDSDDGSSDDGSSDDDSSDDGSPPEDAGSDDGSPPEDAGSGPPPLSRACETNADCFDARVQSHCIAGQCVVTCLLHEHCGAIGGCTGDALDVEGSAVSYCQLDDFPRAAGQYEWRCVNGNSNCDVENGFRCLTSGEGDLGAYCSQFGCDADEECPSGYFCHHDTLLGRPPCEAACERPGAPDDPNCVPSDLIGEGRAFRCKDGALELHSCRRRTFCNECATDADCRAVPNQLCADQGDGTRICTTLCDPDGESCPWGSAADCGVHDVNLGVPTCAHRSGSCTGTGDGCDPCLDDRDCGAGSCSGSLYTGEQFCINPADRCECPAGSAFCLGGGCPLSPAGHPMNCIPAAAGQAPSLCVGSSSVPNDPTSQLACWPDEGP